MLIQNPQVPIHHQSIYQRSLDLAKRNPKHVVRWARAKLNTNMTSIEQAWTRYVLGRALLRWEHINEAQSELQNAKILFQTLNIYDSALYCDYALLVCESEISPSLDLIENFNELIKQCRSYSLDRLIISIQLEIINILIFYQNYNDASLLVTELINSNLRPFDHARLKRFNAMLPGLSKEDLCNQAIHILQRMKYTNEVAKFLITLGWIHISSESLNKAINTFIEAAKIIDRNSLQLRAGLWGKNFSILAYKLGRYDISAHVLFLSLNIFSVFMNKKEIAANILNLGNLFYFTAYWDHALTLYKEAEKQFTTLGIFKDQITSTENQALVLQEKGQFEEALDLLAKTDALITEKHGLNPLGTENIWRIQAETLAKMNHIDEAIERYELTLQLPQKDENKLCMFDCKTDLALLYLQRNEITQAEELLNDIKHDLDKYLYSAWRIYHGLALCAETRLEYQQALTFYSEACSKVAELRKRMPEMISSSLYTQATKLYSDALQCAMQLKQYKFIFEFSEIQRALVVTYQRARQQDVLNSHNPIYSQTLEHLHTHKFTDETDVLSQILAHIKTGTPNSKVFRYIEELSKTPSEDKIFSLEGLRSSLQKSYGDNWTVVNYIKQSDNTIHIAVITPNETFIEPLVIESHLATLDKLSIPRYRRYILGQGNIKGSASAQKLAHLTNALLPHKVQKRLNPMHRLLIIPTGQFHSLPWGALRVNDQWLVQQAIIQLAPSLSLWCKPPIEPDPQAKALLIGCETFAEGGIEPLPHVAQELQNIREAWGVDTATVLLDTNVTSEVLLDYSQKGYLENFGILHIASHAQMLGIDSNKKASLQLFDRELSLSEISTLHLKNTHVVLSACEGATSREMAGDENLSLSWAFLAAGASNIVACLWLLNDEIASHEMPHWYKAMRRHCDAALALAELQRSIIDSYQNNLDDTKIVDKTLYWSSLICLGDSRIV